MNRNSKFFILGFILIGIIAIPIIILNLPADTNYHGVPLPVSEVYPHIGMLLIAIIVVLGILIICMFVMPFYLDERDRKRLGIPRTYP